MKHIFLIFSLILSFSVWANEVININDATQKELESLKGVGPVIAERIVHYREIHGQFSSLHNLEQIKGISSNWVEKHKHQLALSD